MEVWQIALYGAAAVAAARSLASLATYHKSRCVLEIQQREEQLRQQELAKQKAEQEAAKAKAKKAARAAGNAA